jgi:hypothetical protein
MGAFRCAVLVGTALAVLGACAEQSPPLGPGDEYLANKVRPDVPPGPPTNVGKPVVVTFVDWNGSAVPGRTVAIRVLLRDKQSRPVAGRQVVWSSTNGGSFDPATSLSDASGYATTNFTASTIQGTEHVITAEPGKKDLASATLTVMDLGVAIGFSTVAIPRADSCGRADGRLCESLIGNVVADAMRTTYGTDFAITNSGGLRAALTCPTTDVPADLCPAYTAPPFLITRGQVIAVLPFGNRVVTLHVRGDELKAMLENSVSVMPMASGRFAQVSGLCFTYDIAAPAGSRVTGAVRQASGGACTGPAVDLSASATFTLAQNDFMAEGGDGYPDVSSRATAGALMDDVVAARIAASTPISPAIQGRINCTGTDCPAITP